MKTYHFVSIIFISSDTQQCIGLMGYLLLLFIILFIIIIIIIGLMNECTRVRIRVCTVVC